MRDIVLLVQVTVVSSAAAVDWDVKDLLLELKVAAVDHGWQVHVGIRFTSVRLVVGEWVIEVALGTAIKKGTISNTAKGRYAFCYMLYPVCLYA